MSHTSNLAIDRENELNEKVICTKCLLPKERKSFYSVSREKKPNGLHSWCKVCIYKGSYKAQKIRLSKKEYRDKARISDRDSKKRKRILFPGLATKVVAEYRKKYPEKFKAHQLLQYAVKSGKIQKFPCEKCGAVNVHAHHDDYSKPLAVRWLCPADHKAIHPGKIYNPWTKKYITITI